ncbi:MAG: type II secretion system minor pseudopilin GspK [Undibacterium sp.]|nr:type II secretion system minor pseudopilin GspK [Undibacterium sp.]
MQHQRQHQRQHQHQHQHQRGVAVVTALLLTTLAITIVASLFWQQQVQVRSIENQRFQLQKKWVLRGGLDWVGMILREDLNTSGQNDNLTEPWAVIVLRDLKLDQFIENGRADGEESEASLSGKISDAQAKYNLTNLSRGGVIVPSEVKVLAKLLSNLQLDPALAPAVANLVAKTQGIEVAPPTDPNGANNGKTPAGPGLGQGPVIPGVVTSSASGASPSTDTMGIIASEAQYMSFSQLDDLLSVPGFNLEMIAKLRNFVTVLPIRTKVNINTTSAEVLSARLTNVSMSEAALMIAQRDRVYFNNLGDVQNNFPTKVQASDGDNIDVKTEYFYINAIVKLSGSVLEANALYERKPQKTKVLWVKEN